MSKKFQELKPGEPITIRTKKETPSYFLDFINDVRAKEGNSGLLSYLIQGIKLSMQQKKQGLFIPFPPDMSDNEIKKIENNEALMTLIGNILKSSVTLGNPLQMNLVGPPVNDVSTDISETKTTETAEEVKKEPPRKKKSNFKAKGLTNMKKAFD